MKSGSTPYREAALVEKFFFHTFSVSTGNEWDEEKGEFVKTWEKIRHWGRWQTCTKCEREGFEGYVYNHPTLLGWMIGTGIGMTAIAVILFSVKLINSFWHMIG